ncbi:hypothetical protein [Nocardioides sp.]|uniref:hypothetical protein n=1 Tax=Nocardioides sp. TaxID=35761 RepID=UPI002627E9AF|nr:hypothetical protein [Nocardioides sp.]MDI6908637.1 hypothetical protein [Nocardioides sp.]
MAALGTRSLTLTVGGQDVTVQVSNCRIASAPADSDFTSFADAAAGGSRAYHLTGTASQNMETGSLWDQIWNHAGETVAVVVKPNGGAAASATTPTFSGNVVITEPDGDLLGGEANSSATAKFTIDFDWEFTAKPTMAIV